MVQHIVSVCIFCFICATHSPCASHAEITHDGVQYYDNRLPFKDPTGPLALQDGISTYRSDEDGTSKNARSRLKKDINSSSSNKISSDKEDEYLKSIFNTFGDGADSMSLAAFQRLMKRLDLIEEMSLKLDKPVLVEDVNGHAANENSSSLCVDREKMYDSIRNKTYSNDTVGVELFKQACPAILYSMIVGSCSHEDHHDHHDDEREFTAETNRINAWFYSMVAVALISACGILGLAVIPVMQKRFYQPLLQFLVALAVGTLTGDALLHLLPHAMMPEDSHNHSHSDGHSDHLHQLNTWKGFVAMLGLILFFLMERIIMLAAKWRKKKQLKDKLPSRLKVIKPEMSAQLTNAAEKQCKHKYSSFPYCYDEIKMDVDGTHDEHVFQVGAGGENWESHNNTTSTGLDELGTSDVHAYKHKVEKNQNMTECPNDANNANCSEMNKMISSEINKMLDNNKDDTDSIEYTVILREHENRHHGHSHTHGHVHAAPKTMSSVAWMVIMGDGLHNFTDGMAIGAAFASSIAGGFSTAVAVFCHELPHELGDFAMLLKAGMSMKQALFYNLLSSVLCLLGNIFGLWIGTTEYASSWIFAAAAGMFLYIALVDMIPELSSGHEAEGTFFQCMLHLGGLLLGFGIMALIALFEHDLKSIFHES